MPADTPGLAIVIVTCNSRSEIGDCLLSVVGHTAPHPTEVVIVDNASTDDTPGYVRRTFPSVRVIETGENLGFARANNRGAAETSGEFLLLLNPDTVVSPGAHPDVGPRPARPPRGRHRGSPPGRCRW